MVLDAVPVIKINCFNIHDLIHDLINPILQVDELIRLQDNRDLVC